MTLAGAASGLAAEAGRDESVLREEQLVRRAQLGEKEAFAELVVLFQKKVFSLAYGFFPNREDALEIVQETFMRVYEKIGAYRPGHSLQGWIYRLARNLCVDYYRKYGKKGKLVSGFDQVPERQLASAESSLAAWESRRLGAAIDQAVESLSMRQKEVFILKYRQGMKLRQVAETMDVSIGTVKALHHRALNRIRGQVAPAFGGQNESMS
jgi:RNA polymerase sigma-70 factor (ECF subfamily)